MPLGGHDALWSLPLNYRVLSSLIIVILLAFRWRKVLLLHSPPLVPVGGGRCYPLSSLHTLAVTVVADSSLNLVYRNVALGHGAASQDDSIFLGESLLQEQTSPWELILTKPVSDLKLKIGSILGRLARSVGVATLKRSFSKIGVVPHAGLSPNVAPLAFSLLRLHPTFKSQEGLDIFNPKT